MIWKLGYSGDVEKEPGVFGEVGCDLAEVVGRREE